MKYWIIKKTIKNNTDKEDLRKLLDGEINWRVQKERLKKGFREPKNITSLETGDRFIVYCVEKTTRLFCAEGKYLSKRLINNAYELTFQNQAGRKGFNEFPEKINYDDLKNKIKWRPIESSIRNLQEEDYRKIVLETSLGYLIIEETEPQAKKEDKKKGSKQKSVIPIESIAESSLYGMKQAIKYELAHDRKPRDVSDKTVGYDIESRDKNGEEIRYIEVKSRKSNIPVALTDNEFKTACRLGQSYFLYIITNDGIPHIIKDPARTCTSEKTQFVAWLLKDWQEKATGES